MPRLLIILNLRTVFWTAYWSFVANMKMLSDQTNRIAPGKWQSNQQGVIKRTDISVNKVFYKHKKMDVITVNKSQMLSDWKINSWYFNYFQILCHHICLLWTLFRPGIKSFCQTWSQVANSRCKQGLKHFELLSPIPEVLENALDRTPFLL